MDFPRRLKAGMVARLVIAALKRCATQRLEPGCAHNVESHVCQERKHGASAPGHPAILHLYPNVPWGVFHFTLGESAVAAF
jgi:hypothetical protein